MTAEGMSGDAVTSVAIQKPAWRDEFAVFTREQTKMLISAAALMGSNCAKEFALEVLETILQPVSDAEFEFALRVSLAEHDSEELADQVFAKNRSTKNATQNSKDRGSTGTH